MSQLTRAQVYEVVAACVMGTKIKPPRDGTNGGY